MTARGGFRSPRWSRALLAIPLMVAGACGRGLWSDPGSACGLGCLDGGRGAAGRDGGGGPFDPDGAAGRGGATGPEGGVGLDDASPPDATSPRDAASPPDVAKAPDAASAPDGPSQADGGPGRDGATAPADAATRDGSSDARDAGGPADANERPDGASGRDGGGSDACAPGDTCAPVFQSLLASLPCVLHSGSSCTVVGDGGSRTTLAGVAGTVYDVQLRVRGVVETKVYQGACQVDPGSAPSDPWVVGGTPSDDGHNIFQLSISAPPQAYYLNGAPATGTGAVVIDFEKTVRIAAGALITLTSHSGDGAQFANVGSNGTPVAIGGTLIQQPYDGQFVQVDIISVQPEAFPLSEPGMALSFADAQTVTVPDAESLRPTDVTLEAWVNFDGFDPSYVESVVGKPYGPATEDSYAIWYQTAYSSGVAVVGPDNSTSFAWTPSYGEWHHTAMTFDSTTNQTVFYFDGVPSSCAGDSGPPVYDGHDLFIGADTDYDGLFGFWTGAIDEVRVFSRARTPDEVWADMHTDRLGPGQDLAAEWTFDEGAGQTTADSSGNGNTATLGLSGAPESTDPTWIVSTLSH
ncbi:MAG TPA: LamG-like jellyroll fold domain-containing protein [Polyangia bacterium]|nr:LamG-like jellyroll fold domain-containing protein [Polyangia bacterium]